MVNNISVTELGMVVSKTIKQRLLSPLSIKIPNTIYISTTITDLQACNEHSGLYIQSLDFINYSM